MYHIIGDPLKGMKTKADARKLDMSTQAHLRELVLKAVRDGMTQTAAAMSFEMSVREVSRWMKVSREGSPRALRSRRRSAALARAVECQASGVHSSTDHRQDA